MSASARAAKLASAESAGSLTPLWTLLGVGLLLRLLFIGSDGFHNDVSAFESWTLTLRDHPTWQFYASSGFSDYPPGYFMVLWVLAKVYALIGGSDHSYTLLRTLVKLPAIAMDLVNAAVIYAIVRRYASQIVALVAAGALALNPAAIYASSYWGQVDSVSWGLVLIALWCLLRAGDVPGKAMQRVTWAWLALAFSILMKPQAATVGLLFLAYPFATSDPAVRLRRLQATAAGVGAAIGLTLVLGLLFHPAPDVLGWLFGRYAYGSSVYPYNTVNAFNLYALRQSFWQPDSTPLNLFGFAVGPLSVWGICLVAAATVLVVGRYLQRRDDRALLEGAMLCALAFFVLATRMHERYVYGAFLLALPLIGFGRVGWWSSVVLTVTMYLNLAYSLAYQQVMEAKTGGVDTMNLWPAISHPAALANVVLFFVLGYLYLGGADYAVARPAGAVGAAAPSPWSRWVETVLTRGRDWFDPREGTMSLTRLDWVVLSVLSFVGFAIALVHLGVPNEKYFDEVYFPLSAEQYLHGLPQREWTHPPFTKLFIAFSIWLTGDHPFGWRFLNVAIGSAEIGLVYAFAKRLVGSTPLAAVAGLMLAFDGFHLTEERISTGEITIATFIVLTLYALYRFWLASQVRPVESRRIFGPGFWLTMSLGIPVSCVVAWLLNLQPAGHVTDGFITQDINNTAGADLTSYAVAFAWSMLGVYLIARLVVAPRWAHASAMNVTYPDGSVAALDARGKPSWSPPDPPNGTARVSRLPDGSMTYAVPSGGFTFSADGSISQSGDTLVRSRDATVWLLVLCAALGVLISSKWNGFFDLAVVVTVILGVSAQRLLPNRPLFGNPRGFDLGIVLPAIAFSCATIYGISYLPTIVRDHGHTLADILALQWQMFYYHSHVTGTHPYMSSWWQWPIMQIPIVYYYKDFRTGAAAMDSAACCLAEIIALPNPLVFLLGLISVPFTAWLAWRERNKGYALLAVTYVFQWVPWMRTPRMLFEYHFFPNLAIIVLCNVVMFSHLLRRFAFPNRALAVYSALVIAVFAYFYPVLTAVPISYDQWYARMLPDRFGIPYTSWILPHPNRS